ncbi:hypothetical protein [Oceanirhabdus seepicola]|uniref:Uncharacterized protein n=1 Tax=Oceanirhabdus seepicola TaxID=2828781 RepID=A0A9J6NY21_9CLOT|nr:hypothetical protein [Oceanirhabdus seepicola]MCM1989163.1 hypothetical protein [Oceanirhabdus seepicola]
MKKKISLIILSIMIVIVGVFAFIPQSRMMAYSVFINSKEITEFRVDGEMLFMNGEINSKTPKQLKKVVSENPQITTIVMLEVPGSNDDEANFPMCSWIREQGLNTHLTKESLVASGGSDFFLAGNERTMEQGAKIGVHSWSDTSGTEAKDLPKDHPDHEMNRKYIEDMLGKDDFYWYTIYAAPANDIYFMTEEEILKYNMVTQPIENP